MKNIQLIFLSLIISFFGCQANPDDLSYERNYLRGLALSAELEKPILIHFTGYGCVGYNEFIDDLTTSRRIHNILNANFVIVELYVDDRNEIQKNDTLNLHRIDFTKGGRERIKKARTIGQLNAAIEIDLFKSNAQPLYLITDSKGNILIEPFGYTGSDRKYFLEKLDEGLNEFKKGN